MKDEIIHVRIKSEDKANFEDFCDKTGLNVSTAINMCIKAILKDNRFPFEITTESIDDRIYRMLKETEADENNDKYYTLEEVKEGLKIYH